MDETGHSGDTGAAESSNGANSHDHTLLNGWATPDSPWSNAGSALDPEDDVPAWRRRTSESRPFAPRPFPSTSPDLPPGHPPGENHPFADPPPRSEGPLPSWSDGRARYADLLAHLSPNGDRPADSYGPGRLRRPDTLQSDDEQRAGEPPGAPASAPPYPYEGDLDDERLDRRPPSQQRAQVPLERPRTVFPAVRPATPGGRRVDWSTPDLARHALDPTPVDGLPVVDDQRPASDQLEARTPYDPKSFPRRLPYEPVSPAGSAPPAESSPGYATSEAFSGFSGRSAGDPGAEPGEQTSMGLPQRVPAEPDVPTVPEPPSVEPTAETPALARIATHLRRGDVLPVQERQEGFDVKAILAAVREVDGVRDASLRTTPAGAHSLRLDLADGADPAEVSRQVARLLQDRMGLDAAMQGGLGPGPVPAAPSVPTVPAVPTVPPQPPGFTQPQFPSRPAERPPAAPASVSPAPVSAPVPAPAPSPVVSAPPAAYPATPAAYQKPAAPAAYPKPATPSPAFPTSPSAPLPLRKPEPTPVPAGFVSAGPIMEAPPSGLDSTNPRPLEVGERPGPRVLIENVQVNTFGNEANVEVRLAVGDYTAHGVATGPAVDSYLLRLCATATAQAVDELLSESDHADGPAKCFVEHAAAVPFGSMQVAVVVLLLSCGGWVEQLAGSAVVTGDDRHAMVRATLAAVNRRLEALLS